MKKWLFLVVIFIAVYFGALQVLGKNGNFIASNQISPSPLGETAGVRVALTPSPTSLISFPSTLEIPKLGVAANVEQVGLDSQGRMDVPKNVDNVAWYNLGVKPGERGNAVIDGHFDKVTGAPAVFYKLNSMVPGDEILSIDEEGKKYTYKVTDVKTYPYDKLPLQQVFGDTSKFMLNLITCGGEWNTAAQNYSNRTVVYSELVK